MVDDWSVSRTTGQCAVTGRTLEEGEAFYAVLVETPEGFERKDYCESSWDGPPEGAFCYWRSRVPVRSAKAAPLVVDVALLTELFLRLEDEAVEIKQQLRFVLALLLMRKRQFRLAGTVREDGREYWRMLRLADKSEHKVLNPKIDEATIERLSSQLTAILSGDVDAIESPPEERTPSGGEENIADDAGQEPTSDACDGQDSEVEADEAASRDPR